MAIHGSVAAVYIQDPEAALTTFTEILLADQGDHLRYAASFGARYWKQGETFLVEKQVHGAGDWVDVTSSVAIDHLRGKVTFSSANNEDDLVRASGKRVPVVKLSEELGTSLKAQKDEIDATSRDSGLWKEWLMGHKSWTMDSKKHWLNDQLSKVYDGSTLAMLVMFTEDGTSKKNFAGWGFPTGYGLDMDVKTAQDENVTFRGVGEFVWETNA